ncbi:MAG: cellulase family glycosylhydrolase, partial [Oscillospiraceae bacterium]|nr:cellulase family glycosylhydrolase [Oscillospiraceae bacterium]
MNKPLVRQLTALAASAVCSLAMILAVPAAEAAGSTPKDIVEDMGFGWNLGNSLDANNNNLSPTTYVNDGLDTEIAWGNPKVTKELVDAVKAKGFRTIRIPTTWSNHVTDSSYTIDPEWMSRVKEVVNYAYSQDMYVILNVHHEQWNDPSSDNLENGKKVMALIWKQIAEEFKTYGDHLIFEGQN